MPDWHDDPIKTYKEYWEPITGPITAMDAKKIIDELHDYACLMDSVSKVYDDITAGNITKPHTDPGAVVGEVNRLQDEMIAECIEDAIDEYESYLRSWEFIDMPKNSHNLLVFALRDDTPKAERDKLANAVRQTIKKNGWSVSCLFVPVNPLIPKEANIVAIPEEQMNKLGWYKQ